MLLFSSIGIMKCLAQTNEWGNKIKLIVLDPGHFHAALIQKSMYSEIDSSVHVYAPKGTDVEGYLALINKYNTRTDNPTSWNEVIYLGEDYLEKMLLQKTGNLVILAGNNQKKATYISRSVGLGINVLSDKPMAITSDDFEVLKRSFDSAKKSGVLIYDIMTSRYE
ncbi:MAG: putative oxidoreductase C-terminal domain-containing protein, partial [Ginsengibacter sp.]